LKFSNVGTAYGKQVDAYLTFNKVTLHYLKTPTAAAEMDNAQKNAVEFFSISELWEKSAFEIGNIPYVDAAHNNIMNKAFWVEADVTAELHYSDGSDTDLKLVMKPTDIDVVDHLGLKESFYINDYQNAVDKRLLNTANALNQSDKGNQTIWEATTSTSGAYNENNISGLAVRSTDNKLNFGYLSTEACSAVFGLYIEKIDPRPTLEVDPVKVPAKAGQEVTYKGTFKIPVPGKDILATPTTIEMTETFDERLDYKELKIEAGGTALKEGTDYTMEQKGQTVTVKLTPEYIKANASQDIVITYQTATNQKAAEKGAARIENTVTLKVDNLSAPSNTVSTSLLYEKSYE
ncbi:Sgo0707 family adhesin, partial [Streptococcus sp. DD11]|uniref:Sgo0707 family adhesin n=1 Tax=Streptococcus sp. DD11 TaxID=1777879 RepID=UPI0013E3701E